MLKVPCAYCIKTPGRVRLEVGSINGRPIFLTVECAHCKRKGYVMVTDPRPSWVAKSAEAQRLAAHALRGGRR